MRGKSLHNLMAEKAQDILKGFFGSVESEYRVCRNRTVAYFDLFARKGTICLAIEVETTVRHALDNARKAAIFGVPIWIIVPTGGLKSKLKKKLKGLAIGQDNGPIKILILGEMQQELMNYLSWRIHG